MCEEDYPSTALTQKFSGIGRENHCSMQSDHTIEARRVVVGTVVVVVVGGGGEERAEAAWLDLRKPPSLAHTGGSSSP